MNEELTPRQCSRVIDPNHTEIAVQWRDPMVADEVMMAVCTISDISPYGIQLCFNDPSDALRMREGTMLTIRHCPALLSSMLLGARFEVRWVNDTTTGGEFADPLELSPASLASRVSCGEEVRFASL